MNTYSTDVWFQFFVYLARRIDRLVSRSGHHSDQVAHWVKSTAIRLKLDEYEAQAMFWAALLHDIGKIGVPDNVLQKPGPLDEYEWEMMKMHPTIGANIVSSLAHIAHIAPAIHHHQERYDGSGYPHGLFGDQIPLGARILAVADAYQAMTEDRAYRNARSHREASQELRRYKGKQFDPKVVNAFLEVVNLELSAVACTQ
jgi:HD-GYP domain-containing protein (c-di-GMP phosphodiesterase class II)